MGRKFRGIPHHQADYEKDHPYGEGKEQGEGANKKPEKIPNVQKDDLHE